MRTISGLLQIIGLLVVAIVGYWIWYVNWGPNPQDRIGATVATLIPQPLRDWGCGKLNARFTAESPAFCGGSGGSAPSPGDQPSAPPPSPEGGRL
jgi:hypothetical protein